LRRRGPLGGGQLLHLWRLLLLVLMLLRLVPLLGLMLRLMRGTLRSGLVVVMPTRAVAIGVHTSVGTGF
jgi:hypothetical protein